MIAWATMANGFATALGQIFPALNHRPAQVCRHDRNHRRAFGH